VNGNQSQKLRLATAAADQKPGTGSVSDPKGQCPLVDLNPPIFIDAHMHIQSGGCAPLAPLHARMKNINLSRSTIDELGTWKVLQKLATGKIGDVSPLPSDKIGELVVKENSDLAYLGMPAQASYLGICIVLTMDMDYCHIDGYEGLPIYFHDTDPTSKHRGERYYLKRKTGTQPRSECKHVYLDWREDWPLDAEEKNRQIRELESDMKLPEPQKKARIADLEKERRRALWDLAKKEYEDKHPYVPPYDMSGMATMSYLESYQKSRDAYSEKRVREIEAEMAKREFANSDDLTLDRFLKDMNTSLFETWKQQVLRTERVSVANPLRLMPMYHYEPRRYIKEDGSAPFKQLYEQGGAFIGFKMYTSQGYMPDENTKAGAQVAAVTKKFFSRCASLDMPIMAHCTPAGFFTHQRELYLDLASPEVRALYTRIGHTAPGQKDRLRYFQEHFVHPEAWRPVLDANPGLRLCLAHFASDKPLWQDDPAEFKKPALTKPQLRELFKKMDDYNMQLAMWGGAPLSEKDSLDAVWKTNPFPGAAKPSIDASDVIYGKGWIRSIVEMCKTFPNFYTDISYLPTFEPVDSMGLIKRMFKDRRYYWHVLAEIIRLYPHMVNKIMFGTDWYMILLEPYQYMDWFSKTRLALAEVQKTLGGQYTTWNLFHQFAIINPIKFYRLHERHAKIKAALEAKINKCKGIDTKKALKELNRLYETLKRAETKLAQMEQDVKKGPLPFTLSEIDK
jgi:predicted TIM-barrel fold metal-dependent hydrolase